MRSVCPRVSKLVFGVSSVISAVVAVRSAGRCVSVCVHIELPQYPPLSGQLFPSSPSIRFMFATLSYLSLSLDQTFRDDTKYLLPLHVTDPLLSAAATHVEHRRRAMIYRALSYRDSSAQTARMPCEVVAHGGQLLLSKYTNTLAPRHQTTHKKRTVTFSAG